MKLTALERSHAPWSIHALDYRALACDGDGTLMRGKTLARATIHALERLKRFGRHPILATGEPERALHRFPHVQLFDMVVAENGALLFEPGTGNVTHLVESRPASLMRELKKRGIKPESAGRVVVSVKLVQEKILQNVLEELGLSWRTIRNRKSVMALPLGVDKGSGLVAALKKLGLPPSKAVAVGDAENDLAMLRACGCGVAVASAVPSLKRHARFVTAGGAGNGIVEVVDLLIAGALPPPHSSRRAS